MFGEPGPRPLKSLSSPNKPPADCFRESHALRRSVNLVSVSDGRHQLVSEAAGAVLTRAVEVILLLEQPLAVFGEV